tara:strand:+ start:131 stop:475 length:345 start_codon:yes stop_codon:yes gene_type:complete
MILTDVEKQHLITLLRERKEDGSYYGGQSYYYQRTDRLLDKLQEKETKMTDTTQHIKNIYYEYYQNLDKEGKRQATNTVNAFMESVPPKTLAMALTALLRGNKDMFDADELNKK